MATRSTEIKPDGTVLLTLRGERGAVQAIIMQRPFDGVDRPGILGLHHTADPGLHLQQGKCDVLPDGRCFGDTAYRAGYQVADLYDRDREDRAWLVIEDWYHSHIDETEGDADAASD